MRQSFTLSLFGSLLLLAGSLAAQSSLVFTTLDVPGATNTWIFGNNNVGQIVGAYSDSSGAHGFVYKDGVFTGIDDPNAANGTWVTAIDDAGEIVGYFNDSLGQGHGFLLSGGSFTTIDRPGHQSTYLYGVTQNSVYGQLIVGNDGFATGSFWDNLGSFTSVNVPNSPPFNSTYTSAIGINAGGTIVGWFNDSSGMTHGFTNFQTTYTTIDFPGGHLRTAAEGINRLGYIVGQFSDTTGGTHGFVDRSGTFSQIDFPNNPPPISTVVYGINTAGQMVGTYQFLLNGIYHNHGFIAAWPSNPRPFINQPLVPDRAAPVRLMKGSFTLTVNGTDFATGAQVYWNSTPVTTNYVSSTQLTAAIPYAYIMKTGTAVVTVYNQYISGGGGGFSNPQFFTISSSHTVALTRSDIIAGQQPERVVTGDFNGDGILDLAAVDSPNNKVLIFMGNGNGTFQNPYTYATGGAPSNLVVSDFNNDGKLDLATVNNSGNSVSILLGNGNGFFQSHVDFAVGTGPLWLVAGDFDKDGNMDLAALNATAATVSILLGNGDGTFKPQTFKPHLVFATTGTGPSSMTTADLNRDGNLDLVVTNFNSFGGNSVSVFLGNGDGTFRYLYDPTVAQGPLSVIAADFNGDGILDLAVAAGCGDGSSCGRPGSVSILLGLGNGVFQNKVDYNAGSFPYTVVAGDFRSSGVLDLAITDLDSGSLTFLWGQGNGTFPTSSLYTTNGRPVGVITGDFNGDGRLDLAIGGDSPAGVTLMLQQ
jgi:hypothetical protein